MSTRFARGELAAVALAGVVAVVAWALVPTYPNYDSYFHLLWGRELLDGARPGFEAYAAPTQHPLYLVIAAAAGLFGDGGDRLLVLVGVLSLVALVWGSYRLGDAAFGRAPGLLGAAFVGSSFAFLLYAARAYVDVPFLALVIWAAAIEAQAGRDGRDRSLVVMGLLALAGLLRPEAWILGGAYALWRGRPSLVVLAAAPPLAWAAVDLWVTADPLYSLHATNDLAEELNRDRSLADVPGSFVAFLTDTARPPVAAAAVVGAVLAWRLRDRATLRVPFALFAAGALTFAATGLAGLSVLPRYLTVPAVVLCLLGGYGVLGFTTLPDGPARRRWARGALGAAVVGLGFVVARAPVVERLAVELRFIRSTHDELAAILADPAVRRGLRCGPLTLPNYRLVPDARWILDAAPGRVGARSARRRDRGVALFVLGDKALGRFGFAAGASPSTNVPDPGFVPVARNRLYAAYVACPRAN